MYSSVRKVNMHIEIRIQIISSADYYFLFSFLDVLHLNEFYIFYYFNNNFEGRNFSGMLLFLYLICGPQVCVLVNAWTTVRYIYSSFFFFVFVLSSYDWYPNTCIALQARRNESHEIESGQKSISSIVVVAGAHCTQRPNKNINEHCAANKFPQPTFNLSVCNVHMCTHIACGSCHTDSCNK